MVFSVDLIAPLALRLCFVFVVLGFTARSQDPGYTRYYYRYKNETPHGTFWHLCWRGDETEGKQSSQMMDGARWRPLDGLMPFIFIQAAESATLPASHPLTYYKQYTSW